MLYTSGTTGRPKGVYRPEPMVVTAAVTPEFMTYRSDGAHTHLCTGPLYHSAVLMQSLFGPLNAGAGTVLMEQWNSEEALRLIDRHRITHTHMVPTMFHRLLSLPEDVRSRYDVSSLQSVVHGAAPCPVEVKRRMIDWFGPVIWEYFGATEGGGGTMVDSATWLAHPGTVGKPVMDGQMMIGDDAGNPLPIGEIGMVYVKPLAQGSWLRVLQGSREDGRHVSKRLLHLGRRWLRGQRRLLVPHRPFVQSDYFRGSEHLPCGSGRGVVDASCGR